MNLRSATRGAALVFLLLACMARDAATQSTVPLQKLVTTIQAQCPNVFFVSVPNFYDKTTWTMQYSGLPFAVTGSIAGTTLTVTAPDPNGGLVEVNDVISGTGVTGGTYVTALGTGTGGNGTYTVSASQTVSSTTISSSAVTSTCSSNAQNALNLWNYTPRPDVNADDWFWIANDTNPTTQVYGYKDGLVANTQTRYQNWLAAGPGAVQATISGAADNGSGLIRLTVSSSSNFQTGQYWQVADVAGTTEANGTWKITVIDGTHVDLQASTFTNAYVSGGVVWGASVVSALSTAVQAIYNMLGPTASGTVNSIPNTTGNNVFYNIYGPGGLGFGSVNKLVGGLHLVGSCGVSLSSNVNDWQPAAGQGLGACSMLQVTPTSDAGYQVTGLDASELWSNSGITNDGFLLHVVNVGSHSFVLKNLNTSSLAANRLSLGSDLPLAPAQAVMLRYDAMAAYWRPFTSYTLPVTQAAVVVTPQGRLTLQSATPVMTADQVNKATLYYDCFNGGRLVPYYNSSNDLYDTISSCEVSTAMASSGTGVLNNAGVFDVWWEGNTHHTICVSTNGSGGGWASDTGGSNTARGTGYSQLDKTTRPYITNANTVSHCYNGSTDYGGIAPNKLTYLGTLYTTAAGQTGVALRPTGASGGTANVIGLSNAYNRVEVTAISRDTAASWTIASTTWRYADNNGNNQISWVDGLQQSPVRATYFESGAPDNVTSGAMGISYGPQLDWSSGAPDISTIVYLYSTVAAAVITAPMVNGSWYPQMGLHSVSGVEAGYNATSTTVYGSGAGSTTGQMQALTVTVWM